MKLSIITPSFNSGRYIERAIQSVLSQDYDNWEHIIVDGGSTDGTLEILKKYPHLKWISEPDKGQSDAMNKGFAMTAGEIIGYLNADDFYKKNVFKGIIYLLETSNIEMLVGGLVVRKFGVESEAFPSTVIVDIIKFDDWKFPVNPVSYFYKKHVQSCIGDFPINLHYAMDYWFLLRAYSQFKVGAYQGIMGTFDLNDASKTNNYSYSFLELLVILLSFLKENNQYISLLTYKEIKYYNLKKAESLIKTQTNLWIKFKAFIDFSFAYPFSAKSQFYLLKKLLNE